MNKDHISRQFPGLSISLCFGKYGGFNIRWSEGIAGICLGWVALTCYAFDTEEAVSALLNKKDNATRFSAN